MSAIPEQSLQEINCYSRSFILNDEVARVSFTRTTLHTVIFEVCVGINSRSLSVLLIERSKLEVFQVTWVDHLSGPTLHLEDAVFKPWGSTSFRRLSLTIGIPAEHPTHANDRPCYMRKSPVARTEAAPERFASLEMLYRQIGSLVELEHLDLRVDIVDALGESFGDTTYEYLSFPGLISLSENVPAESDIWTC